MWSELTMFLKTIDIKLTVFENINTLYFIVNFNPGSKGWTFKTEEQALNFIKELKRYY